MLWSINKYKMNLRRGESRLVLDSMFGVIQQLSVSPSNKDTIWSLRLLDKDLDIIYEKIDIEGRLDEFSNIPIGNQVGETPVLHIFDSTSNEQFKVIVKVREIV